MLHTLPAIRTGGFRFVRASTWKNLLSRAGLLWQLQSWEGARGEHGSGLQYRRRRALSCCWSGRSRPCTPRAGAAGLREWLAFDSWWQTHNETTNRFVHDRTWQSIVMSAVPAGTLLLTLPGT